MKDRITEIIQSMILKNIENMIEEIATLKEENKELKERNKLLEDELKIKENFIRTMLIKQNEEQIKYWGGRANER